MITIQFYPISQESTKRESVSGNDKGTVINISAWQVRTFTYRKTFILNTTLRQSVL